MERYRYQPLSHEDSIRLVAILPGTLDNPSIHCNIIPWRLLSSTLYFEALSYAWGDAADQVTIFCDETLDKLQVTRNCYNALRQLRLVDGVRMIWIDAICIDQENSSERTIQIRMMGHIYSSADQVVVYVGEETAGSQALFQELYAVESSVPEGLTWYNHPLPSVEIVQELGNILIRPWFTRVWVLQEVYLAKSVVIQCGSAHVPLDVFQKWAEAYSNTMIASPAAHIALSREFPLKTKTATSEYDAALRWWNVIGETRLLLATDPRDRIFALKGLVPYNGPGIDQMISYNRSAERVFTDIALFILPHVELILLLATRHPHSRSMASWVPDWSQNTYPDISWLGSSILCGKSSSERGMVPCPGHALVSHNETYIGRHLTLRFVKSGDGTYRDSHTILHVKGVSCSSIATIGNTFDWNETRRICSNTILEMQKLCQGLKNPKSFQNSELLPSVLPNRHVPPEILEALKGIGEDQLGTLLRRGANSYSAKESLHGCQLFLDDTGRLGIAPEGAQKGDTICILEGAAPETACLLRRRHDSGWILISGNCYLHRLMKSYSENNRVSLCNENEKVEFDIW